MIKKIIQDLIWSLLVLEIRVRGERIKEAAWRLHLFTWLTGYKIGGINNLRFFFHNHKKIGYLNIPKAGCTSLTLSLFESHSEKDKCEGKKNVQIEKEGRVIWKMNVKEILHDKTWKAINIDKERKHQKKQISLDELRTHFIFTFVRNPFTRFVSFFRSKYQYDGSYYHCCLKELVLIEKAASFDELVVKISKLPNSYLDRHAVSQHVFFDLSADQGVQIDFIGKFEKLEEEFEPIRQRFDLLSLSHEKKSAGGKQDWRDYYTAKTAKLIYQRYHRDFEMFGYEEEYPKLLSYLSAKSGQD